jgi:hypothetical protein
VEISQAAAAWIQADNEVYMLTFTARHVAVMALAALLNLISAAFRSVIRGRPWRRLCDELGIAGTIRSLEVTHGANGFHPHLHCLLFIEGTLDNAGLAKLDLYFKGQRAASVGEPDIPGAWGRFIESVCRDCGKQKPGENACACDGPACSRLAGLPEPKPARCDLHGLKSEHCRSCGKRKEDVCTCGGPVYEAPSYEHGVHIERCYTPEDAAKYICKTQESHKNVGSEMARSDMKTARGEHRVPFQILASAAEGNEADARLWHEFEAATKGKKCITWSRGLRDVIWCATPEPLEVGFSPVELTDEEIVALEPVDLDDDEIGHVPPRAIPDSPDDDVVARVSPLAMRHARLIPGFRMTVLEAFEAGGVDHLAEVVRDLGFEVRWDCDGLVPLIVPVLRALEVARYLEMSGYG